MEEIKTPPQQTPIIPPPLPVAPPVEPRKLKLPFIILGIVFFAALLAIGGFYFKTQETSKVAALPTKAVLPTVVPTKDPTADWKKFDGAYFSLRYSDNFVPKGINNSQTVERVTFEQFGNEKNNHIDVTIMKGGKSLFESRKEVYLKFPPYSMKQDNILIDGIAAWRISGADQDGGNFRQYILFYKDELEYEINTFNIEEAILNQIYPTFKINNSELKPSTSQDTTYTDKDFGYKITYPKDTWQFRRTYGKDIQKSAPTDILSGIDLTLKNGDFTKSTIVVNILDAQGLTDIEEWIKKYDLNYPKTGTKETIKFQEIPAVKYKYVLESNKDSELIYFISGKYVYRLNYFEATGISDEVRGIVNSFKP